MKLMFFILFFAFSSFSSSAFYIECKDTMDSKTEVRIFQNDSKLDDLVLLAQTTIRGTSFELPLKMNNARIVKNQNNKIDGIVWEGDKINFGVYIVISDDYLRDGRDIVSPIPHKALINIEGKMGGMKLIDSNTFACRQYRNN